MFYYLTLSWNISYILLIFSNYISNLYSFRHVLFPQQYLLFFVEFTVFVTDRTEPGEWFVNSEWLLRGIWSLVCGQWQHNRVGEPVTREASDVLLRSNQIYAIDIPLWPQQWNASRAIASRYAIRRLLTTIGFVQYKKLLALVHKAGCTETASAQWQTQLPTCT